MTEDEESKKNIKALQEEATRYVATWGRIGEENEYLKAKLKGVASERDTLKTVLQRRGNPRYKTQTVTRSELCRILAKYYNSEHVHINSVDVQRVPSDISPMQPSDFALNIEIDYIENPLGDETEEE